MSDSAYCRQYQCGRRAAITARDGQPYCKRHADRLPKHLRRASGQSSGKATRHRGGTRRDSTDPYREVWT